jgi:hypothetical protein
MPEVRSNLLDQFHYPAGGLQTGRISQSLGLALESRLGAVQVGGLQWASAQPARLSEKPMNQGPLDATLRMAQATPSFASPKAKWDDHRESAWPCPAAQG